MCGVVFLGMQTILIVIGIYLLVRFVFNFIIPVVRTTVLFKKRMQAMENTHKDESTINNAPNDRRTTSGKGGLKEDYIEFEEVK